MTVPPATAPATAPLVTGPPATAAPAPVPHGAVALASCRITGTDLTATGTVTNAGPNAQRYRAHALVVDAGGVTVADVGTDVGTVPPGASLRWAVTDPIDPVTSGRAAACKAGAAEPV